MGANDELGRMKSFQDMETGVLYFRDPGTVKKKKNRHRHVKDGCPKSERGKVRFGEGIPFQEVRAINDIGEEDAFKYANRTN